MKKTMATAAGLLCALALSAAAVPTKPMTKPMTKTAGTTIWGDVQNVDAKTNALTLAEKSGKTVTVTLAATTKYTRGGNNAAVTAAALKTGERVRVVAQNGSAQNVHVFVTWVAGAKTVKTKKS